MKEKSEFGKGLVICLVKFAEHFENSMCVDLFRYKRMLDLPKEKRTKNESFDWWFEHSVPIWGSEEKALAQAIELWYNGASDHLYEIEVPKGKEWDSIRKKVKKLQKKGLEIGHSFTRKIWKVEDVSKLQYLTREISLMIDKKIGLKPDKGEF